MNFRFKKFIRNWWITSFIFRYNLVVRHGGSCCKKSIHLFDFAHCSDELFNTTPLFKTSELNWLLLIGWGETTTYRWLMPHTIILFCWYYYCLCWKVDDGSILLYWYDYWWSWIETGEIDPNPIGKTTAGIDPLFWDSSDKANSIDSSFEANNDSYCEANNDSYFEANGTTIGLPLDWTGATRCSLALVIRLRANSFSASENNPPYCWNII